MLPADQRLRKNADFRLIYKRGRENVHPLAVLYIMRRVGPDAANVGRRIGFVVSKKQGDAVVRNRIKRRLREAVRLRLSELRPGAYDLVFVARGRLKAARWTEIEEAVALLLQRARVLADTNSDTNGRPVPVAEGKASLHMGTNRTHAEHPERPEAPRKDRRKDEKRTDSAKPEKRE